MSAGSVLIYSGSVFHGGGANSSRDDRIGINITYALGWLRQEPILTCPPEIAKDLPRDLRIGRIRHRPSMRWGIIHHGGPGEKPKWFRLSMLVMRTSEDFGNLETAG